VAHPDRLLVEWSDRPLCACCRDIAAHVGKAELECKKHYEDVYLTSGSAPLPDESRRLTTIQRATSASSSAAASETAVASVDEEATSAVVLDTPLLDGVRHGPDDEQLTVSSTSKRARPRSGRPPSSSVAADVVDPDVSGFMPLRGDFDIEWDNDAEILLADMEFREGEHPTETELKLKVIEIYNAKLDERERRKRFILERGLLAFRTRLAEERRRPREEREIRNQLRPFARFHSHADHEALVEALMEEHRLRRRIAQLQHWRRQGIQTMAEAEEYEAAKRQRDTEKKLMKQRESAAYLYGNSQPVPSSSSSSVAAPVPVVTPRSDSDPLPPFKRVRATEDACATDAPPRVPSLASSSSVGAGNGPVGAKNGEQEFSIDGAPGAALLTEAERELCGHMRILPSQFQAIKRAVIAAAADSKLDLAAASDAARSSSSDLSATQCAAVFDYCIACGWVSSEPGPKHLQRPTPENTGNTAC
jgi:transcriptional adapter 2-alpha